MRTVDVWAQITNERMAKRPWLETLMRWTARSGEHLLSSPERTLAAMDEGGVDIAFLSAWHGPEGNLISNEEVARQIDAAPTRFRGLASVDLHKPMAGFAKFADGSTVRSSLACVSCLTSAHWYFFEAGVGNHFSTG
jgi:predicted TIM-barrel fold metal-dependent hydrolase